jgi:predicted SprT family Zn-dependent metalloprotease
MPNPTTGTYNALSRAFAHFNARLFGGLLPECLITYQRHHGAYGFFTGNQFADLADTKTITDEIALNPATFIGRTPTDILSTLAHEMAHLWQHHFGKPSRGGYHNRQWAQKMREIGLHPSDTGQPGGKQTGPRVSHYIVRGGLFELACRDFLARETMPLFADRDGDAEARARKSASKTKYTCPECGINAWAKPETQLLCGQCEETMLTEDEMPENAASPD